MGGVEVTRSPPLPQNRHQRASLLPQHEADTQHSPKDDLKQARTLTRSWRWRSSSAFWRCRSACFSTSRLRAASAASSALSCRQADRRGERRQQHGEGQ